MSANLRPRSGLLKRASEIPELDKAIEDYDIEEFVRVVTEDHPNINFYDFELDDLDPALFFRMLLESSPLMPKLPPTPPYLLCPSWMERAGVVGSKEGRHLSAEWVVEHFSLIDVLDEYLGVCYHPDRLGDRFDANFKKEIAAYLKTQNPKTLRHHLDSWDLTDFMEPADLFAIGIKTLPKDVDPW